MEKFNINGIIYDLVDSYDYGNNESIRILKKGDVYYIDNYEGIGLYMGPYADARKTGDNGEILVKDLDGDFYYVPDIEMEKPYGVGFIKYYHPEYHFAKPYTYDKFRLYAPVQMKDGSIRIKQSTGRLSDEKYKYYFCDSTRPLDVFEDENGKPFASAIDLTLPLEYLVRPDSGVDAYQGKDVPSYQIAKEYADYKTGVRTLDSLSHYVFLNDQALEAILKNEKRLIKEFIVQQAQGARDSVNSAANKEDLKAIDEVDIDMDTLQQMLNLTVSIIIEKRKVAVREQEKLSEIDKKEIKAENKADKALSFEEIIKQSTKKTKKKNIEEEVNAKVSE